MLTCTVAATPLDLLVSGPLLWLLKPCCGELRDAVLVLPADAFMHVDASCDIVQLSVLCHLPPLCDKREGG